MADLHRTADVQSKKHKKEYLDEHYEELSHSGRIVARVIDAHSGLREIAGIYAIRMKDEGVRRLLMNDYTPTLGKIVGDITFLVETGEVDFQRIRGFYKLQHNVFTLLIEEHFSIEDEEATGE